MLLTVACPQLELEPALLTAPQAQRASRQATNAFLVISPKGKSNKVICRFTARFAGGVLTCLTHLTLHLTHGGSSEVRVAASLA